MRFDEPRRHAGDDRDFALGLRRREHHHALAELLLEVVDQRAQLPAFELIGAMREHFHALDFDSARDGFIEPAGSRLHAHLFQLAA